MKNLMKKTLLVVSALVIALGTITMVTGCKKKDTAPTPKKETPKKTTELPE